MTLWTVENEDASVAIVARSAYEAIHVAADTPFFTDDESAWMSSVRRVQDDHEVLVRWDNTERGIMEFVEWARRVPTARAQPNLTLVATAREWSERSPRARLLYGYVK